MTTLYDDRGLKVDFFERILSEHKRIGITWSGGADSTFTFWYFAKLLHDNNLTEHSILPVTGYEYVMRYQPIEETEKVYKIITESFPNANILPRYTYDFMDDHKGPKGRYWDKEKPSVTKKYNIDRWVNAMCSAPVFEEVGDWGEITAKRTVQYFLKHNLCNGSPWRLVDKKFIAYQYRKFDLMESLYPLTGSCVNPDWNGNPCKQCDWCKEKYWAFGCYDRGIK
jgi:hypothetical protein